MRIGPFDPPTRAYLALAEDVLSRNLVDKVHLMPAFHTYEKKATVAKHRLAMAQAAAQTNPQIKNLYGRI